MYLTLNISSKDIRLLAIDKEGVKRWSRKELPSGWVKDGNILEPKGVGAIILSLLESADILKSRVAICISGLPFTYRMAKLPRMKQSLLKDSIKHFMRKETSMPIEQMHLSWAVMDESDDEVELLVLGIDQKIIDAIAETMRETKIKYWTLGLKPLVLSRASSLDSAILISAEYDCYDIIIIDNRRISTMHTVYIEEENQSDIQHSKQILIETSKAITYDTKKRGHLPEKKIPLLLTGELSCDKDFRDLIQTELGYTVKLLTPPLALQADFPVHLYSTNIGLALSSSRGDLELLHKNASAYNDINLDIMLGRYAPQPKRISNVTLMFPIIISLIACLAVPIYGAQLAHSRESLRLQDELTAVDQQLQQARLAEEKARIIEVRTNELQARVENLRKGYQELFGNQGEFAANLRKVINALPPYSYFTHVNHSPEQITVTGHADNALQVLNYTKNLEQEGSFSDIRIQQIGDASGDNVTYSFKDNPVTFEVIIDNGSK
ncbi:MAG: PilN domain-containing protein [Candidatus Hodarchaeota archaeon]